MSDPRLDPYAAHDPLADRLRAFGRAEEALPLELAPPAQIHRGGDRRRRRQNRAAVGGTLAVALLVGGVVFAQGVGRDAAGPVVPAGGGTVTVTATQTASGPAPSESTSSAPSGSAAVVDVTAVGFGAFATPTGNIVCAMTAGYVRCEPQTKTWSAGAAPASCDFVYGTSVQLDQGVPGYTCSGDTALDAANVGMPGTEWAPQTGAPTTPGRGGATRVVLEYGKALRLGTLQCTSRPDGVHCADDATGHGFVVSKAEVSFS